MPETGYGQARRFRFRRCDRLTLQRDLDRVFQDRCTKSDDLLVVYVSPNGRAWSRLGISVSRRIGNAVRRNYAKRRIREAFRTRRSDIPTGYDFVFVAKPPAAQRGAAITEAVVELSRGVVRKMLRRLTAGKPELRSLPPSS